MFLLVFVPVLGAFVAHAPVLQFGLLRSLKCAIDGGATFRGRRLFGDNKTWRGALVMSCGIVLAALALSAWPWYSHHLPAEVRDAGAFPFGLLLALGTVAGELPNSFLKRQLDIAPGAQRRSLAGVLISLFDQGDFVLGIWIALLPIWVMTPAEAALAFGVVASVHFAVNLVGYVGGARQAPI